MSATQGSKILNDRCSRRLSRWPSRHEQLHQIRALEVDYAVCFIGSLTAMISGGAIAPRLGATPAPPSCRNRSLRRSPWPSRLARRHSGDQRGSASFVGILGAVFGHTLFNLLKITTHSARGLAMGTASHALAPHAARRYTTVVLSARWRW